MEQADSCCGTGAEPWRDGLGGYHSYPADARSGTTETIRDHVSGRPGAVRTSATGDGRLRSAADISFRQGGDSMRNQPERKSPTENLDHMRRPIQTLSGDKATDAAASLVNASIRQY